MAEGTASGKHVLIVEDQEVEREGLAAILQREGYTVALALDADGALAYLRANPGPTAVVLDMMLKGRDGWQFLAERQRDPALARVPVVITTAVRVASPEWARSLGAQAFFRKPIPVTPLLQELRRLLGEAA